MAELYAVTRLHLFQDDMPEEDRVSTEYFAANRAPGGEGRGVARARELRELKKNERL